MDFVDGGNLGEVYRAAAPAAAGLDEPALCSVLAQAPAPNTHARTRTHARARARTHTHTHTHTPCCASGARSRRGR